MIDTVVILPKARSELGRLNKELVDLHWEEERLKLRRTRLEEEKARVQRPIDVYELTQRLEEMSVDATIPTFHIERVAGTKVVVPDKVVVSNKLTEPIARAELSERRKLKPGGLPTISTMIITALRETGKASRPVEIAEFVRQRWWATAPIESIATTAWQMAKAGKLTHHDGRYGLNRVGHNGAGH